MSEQVSEKVFNDNGKLFKVSFLKYFLVLINAKSIA